MGSKLYSQVMLGAGLPFPTQVKRTEDPGDTDWSVKPCTMEAGSVKEERIHQNIPTLQATTANLLNQLTVKDFVS